MCFLNTNTISIASEISQGSLGDRLTERPTDHSTYVVNERKGNEVYLGLYSAI